MSIKNVEMQDNSGNIYYPHTNSDIVKYGGSTVGVTLLDLTNKVNNIKIADGTTEQKGIVKLNNTVTSTSIVEAATANAVKTAYDKGNEALNKANQAFQYANNGKTNIANVIGYVTGNNTHQEIANEIQNDKNILANNLNSKGVGANGNSPLRDLANIVGNITLSSMGGKKFKSGSVNASSSGSVAINFKNMTTGRLVSYNEYITVGGLDFKPSIIIVYFPGNINYNPSYGIYASSFTGTAYLSWSYDISKGNGFLSTPWDVSDKVVQGGFTLPSETYGFTYYWMAFE